VNRRLVFWTLTSFALAAGLFAMFAPQTSDRPASNDKGAQVSSRLMAQKDQDECRPWQHKGKDDKCVDNPGTVHHHGRYEPEPGETCWVECLCGEGQYPGGDDCSPCSYVGMVCSR
jgi:hypothetical protein